MITTLICQGHSDFWTSEPGHYLWGTRWWAPLPGHPAARGLGHYALEQWHPGGLTGAAKTPQSTPYSNSSAPPPSCLITVTCTKEAGQQSSYVCSSPIQMNNGVEETLHWPVQSRQPMSWHTEKWPTFSELQGFKGAKMPVPEITAQSRAAQISAPKLQLHEQVSDVPSVQHHFWFLLVVYFLFCMRFCSAGVQIQQCTVCFNPQKSMPTGLSSEPWSLPLRCYYSRWSL